MPTLENLVKQTNQRPAGGIRLKHTLTVVSGMSNNDVDTAERTVHSGHISQMPNFHFVAAENLRVETGLPVDVYVNSRVVDLEEWKAGRKVGEYYKSPDGGTFTFTELVEDRGSQRVETVAFTSRSRVEVRSSLGEPEQSPESNIIPFPQREELDRAA